jgi:hypothetical protein
MIPTIAIIAALIGGALWYRRNRLPMRLTRESPGLLERVRENEGL